jgi:hypothetical protein
MKKKLYILILSIFTSTFTSALFLLQKQKQFLYKPKKRRLKLFKKTNSLSFIKKNPHEINRNVKCCGLHFNWVGLQSKISTGLNKKHVFDPKGYKLIFFTPGTCELLKFNSVRAQRAATQNKCFELKPGRVKSPLILEASNILARHKRRAMTIMTTPKDETTKWWLCENSSFWKET